MFRSLGDAPLNAHSADPGTQTRSIALTTKDLGTNAGLTFTVWESGISTDSTVRIANSDSVIISAQRNGVTLGLLAINAADLAAPSSEPLEVTISPETTAEALIALSPLMLNQGGLARSIQNTQDISHDQAVAALAAVIRTNPDLSNPNAELEARLAAVLDRVPAVASFADQGCDSVLNNRAVTLVGGCALPVDQGLEFHNEIDRWVAVFPTAEEANNSEGASAETNSAKHIWKPCALISPAPHADSIQTIDASCVSSAFFISPGALSDNAPLLNTTEAAQAGDLTQEGFAENLLRTAGALTINDEYVLPLLVHSGVSSYDEQVFRLELVSKQDWTWSQLQKIVTTNEMVRATASDALGLATTPQRRLDERLAIANAILASPDFANQFAFNVDGANRMHMLLRIYDRSSQEMKNTDTEIRWSQPTISQAPEVSEP